MRACVCCLDPLNTSSFQRMALASYCAGKNASNASARSLGMSKRARKRFFHPPLLCRVFAGPIKECSVSCRQTIGASGQPPWAYSCPYSRLCHVSRHQSGLANVRCERPRRPPISNPLLFACASQTRQPFSTSTGLRKKSKVSGCADLYPLTRTSTNVMVILACAFCRVPALSYFFRLSCQAATTPSRCVCRAMK